jgi:hypothetical protein
MLPHQHTPSASATADIRGVREGLPKSGIALPKPKIKSHCVTATYSSCVTRACFQTPEIPPSPPF